MSATIKLRRSSVAGNRPTTDQLALGEVAINTHDGTMSVSYTHLTLPTTPYV